jgi:hypothetical protein
MFKKRERNRKSRMRRKKNDITEYQRDEALPSCQT